MKKNNIQSSFLETHLGQKSEGSVNYDPSLLRRIERFEERNKNNIGPVVPFYGMDIWNAYEFSFLNRKGVPMQYILKIMYSSDSKYMVESKSLKLYLNSFAMTKMDDIEEAVELIIKDLETLLEYKVHVVPFSIYTTTLYESPSKLIPSDFIRLDDEQILNCAEISEYKRNPDLLIARATEISERTLVVKTSSLRSNCKVTNQPDYADLYIAMFGPNLPTKQSLYKYIVSYRNENHFHEEIVEQIYIDLQEKFQPIEMLVLAQYTRRGGIDINPVRYSHIHLIEDFGIQDYLNMNKRFYKTIRQ